MDADITFDFERTLEAQQPASTSGQDRGAAFPGNRDPSKPRNYRQTVCTYWLRSLCMKGDTCGFLHQFDPQRMPVCRNLLKFGVCKEADCPFKHSTEEIKECNMYRLGFCIYGPACRFKHTRQPGPPPDPEGLEACKPREFRNINIVANQANDGIQELPDPRAFRPRRPGGPGQHHGGGSGGGAMTQYGGSGGGGGRGQAPRVGMPQVPGFVDASILATVGQQDGRYGF